MWTVRWELRAGGVSGNMEEVSQAWGGEVANVFAC